MLLLLMVLQLSFPSAMACDIDRSITACAKFDCADSASQDFAIYKSNEAKCGVLKGSLPYVLKVTPGKPKRGTIVLVHGLTAGPDHMRHIATELRDQGYNVVVPILKGHGASDEDLRQASIEEWKKDVNFAGTIAERLGKPVHILGHSTGGMLAAIDAADHPGRYKSIVGLDPVFNFNGTLSVQTKLPCFARHLWDFPSEILAGHAPISDYINDQCSGNTLPRQPDVIRFEIDRQIQDIVEKTCAGGNLPIPHFNYERPLQALCALKQGTDELSSDKIKKLPPIHLELTEDPAIFDYESRDELINDVKANPGSTVNTLKTDEIEKNTFHELMLAPCAQHYPEMAGRIKDWFKSHSK